MWVNKKPPIEALREAQLTIYRADAEQIAPMAGERGAPSLKVAVAIKSDPSDGRQPAVPGKDPRRADARRPGGTPTKLWAAFVLSGVGR
jgi:hypothetical protein